MADSRNIMVTGFGNSSADVMVFTTTHTTEMVETKLKEGDWPYTDIYEVRDDELKYYVYEPYFLD